MAYTRINWENTPSTATPRNATNLNKMDKGIYELTTGWISADETWTYSSVDDPTGVITISGDVTTKYSLGMRIKFTNGGNTIYGIITKISYSSPNTTLTFLHEIDPTDSLALHLMANSAITNNYYSSMKVPYGFPINPDKWTLKYEASALTFISSPVINQWYNLGTLSLPVGLWNVTYNAVIATTANGTAPNRCFITIGQTSASQGSAGCMTGVNSGYNEATSLAPATNTELFNLSSPSTIYLTFMTNQSAKSMVDVYANGTVTTIRAVCGYL